MKHTVPPLVPPIEPEPPPLLEHLVRHHRPHPTEATAGRRPPDEVVGRHPVRVETIAAELLAWKPGPDLGRAVAPPSMQRCPRFLLREGWVHRLDAVLEPASGRRVDVPAGARLLAATPDLSSIVAAVDDLLYVEGDHAFGLPVAGADSATCLGMGALLVTAPVMERSTLQGPAFPSRGAVRVILIDGHRGDILDERLLDVSDAGIIAVPHPWDGSVVLDAGEGQDGSRAFVVRASGSQLTIEPLFQNVVIAGFDEAGGCLLLTPHPSFDNIARLVTWPTLEEIGSVEGGDDVDGSFDLYGFLLGSGRALLSVVEAPPLVCTPELQPIARVAMELRGVDEPVFELMASLSDDVFAAELWVDGASSLTIWRLPS